MTIPDYVAVAVLIMLRVIAQTCRVIILPRPTANLITRRRSPRPNLEQLSLFLEFRFQTPLFYAKSTNVI